MTRKNKQTKFAFQKRDKRNSEVEQLRKQVSNLKMRKPRDPTPFSDVGAHLGNMLGFKDIGRGIGGVIGRVFGSGDYQTNFNSVSNNTLTSKVPAFGNESTIITHREYIKDLISAPVAGDFKLENFRINPTNDELFPWLATIAQNFEEYTILGMVVEFKSMSGQSVAATNTQLGSVIIATQYDPTKPAFVSKQQMENYFFAQSTVPANSILHAIECKSGSAPLRSLYTSGGTAYDPRFVDYGNLQIASVGLPGTSVNMGELWVSYMIELKKPRLSLLADFSGAAKRFSRDACTASLPFGIADKSGGLLPVTVTPTTVVVGEVNFGDVFSVSFCWSSVGAGVYTAPALTFTNCAQITGQFNNETTSVNVAGVAASSQFMTITFLVSATTQADFLVVTLGTAGAFGSGTAYCDIMVVALDPTAKY